MTNDTIPSWEVRRPDVLLAELAQRHPFDRPQTLLARVDGGYEQQRLTDSTVLWDEPADDESERTRLTEQALERLGFSRTADRYADWPLAVPVVVRPGPVWFSWDESEALLGLRYGSNLCDVREGDVLTAGLTRSLKRNGGYCDCEVLMNVYPDREPASGRTGRPCPHPRA